MALDVINNLLNVRACHCFSGEAYKEVLQKLQRQGCHNEVADLEVR